MSCHVFGYIKEIFFFFFFRRNWFLSLIAFIHFHTQYLWNYFPILRQQPPSIQIWFAKQESIPVIRMTELMSQCQSWLPDPSVHSSSNFTTKQWYQKWIMGGLWDGSRRLICQKRKKKLLRRKTMGIDPSRVREERIEKQDQAKGNHFGRSGCNWLSMGISIAVLSSCFHISCFCKPSLNNKKKSIRRTGPWLMYWACFCNTV